MTLPLPTEFATVGKLESRPSYLGCLHIIGFTMSQLLFRSLLLLPLLAVASISGCRSSENPAPVTATKNAEGSRATGPNDGSSATRIAAAEKWVATLDHGHAPGNGYELSVRDGRISNGKFYLLDPNAPHDVKHAVQTVAFEDIEVSEKEITFSITLQSNPKEYRDRLTIRFPDRFSGKVGQKVRAKVQSKQANTVSQDLVFERRE
jgi:hypothetical protein